MHEVKNAGGYEILVNFDVSIDKKSNLLIL